jgi:hypothetical protein
LLQQREASATVLEAKRQKTTGKLSFKASTYHKIAILKHVLQFSPTVQPNGSAQRPSAQQPRVKKGGDGSSFRRAVKSKKLNRTLRKKKISEGVFGPAFRLLQAEIINQ